MSALCAVLGMKFGYEMKSKTMIVYPVPAIDADSLQHGSTVYFNMLARMCTLTEIHAQNACYHIGYEGWAVLNYASEQAHAVPYSDAVETYSPMFSSIDCKNLKLSRPCPNDVS